MTTNNDKYDVAIIGGGVAGCSLAIQLAQKGIKVIVLEKDQYPAQKVCGEYISRESWNFLNRLGVDLKKIEPPVITRLRMSSPSGSYFEHDLDPGGFGLSRYFLDKALADLAVKNGATVQTGTAVWRVENGKGCAAVISREGKVFQARLVCGAFGKKSRLDYELGRKGGAGDPGFVGVKYHVKADLPASRIELHVFQGGYCGISRVENDRYCLCYVVDSGYLKKYKTIPTLENNLLSENPWLRKYFSQFEKIAPPVTLSGLRFGLKNTADHCILYAGDAAGFIAPLTGNGMSMAMRASFILANLIPDYLSGGDESILTRRYADLWNRHFRFRIRASLLLQRLVITNPSLANFTISAFRTLPFLASPFIRLTHGREF